MLADEFPFVATSQSGYIHCLQGNLFCGQILSPARGGCRSCMCVFRCHIFLSEHIFLVTLSALHIQQFAISFVSVPVVHTLLCLSRIFFHYVRAFTFWPLADVSYHGKLVITVSSEAAIDQSVEELIQSHTEHLRHKNCQLSPSGNLLPVLSVHTGYDILLKEQIRKQ